MIVGVAAADDESASDAIETIARHWPTATLAYTVGAGIGVALLREAESLVPSTFGGDYAHVGTVGGDLPGYDTELRGDFALVRRARGCLQLMRARFDGRPLYWQRLGAVTVASNRLLPLAILGRAQLRLNFDHLLALFDSRLLVWRSPPPFVGVHRVRANAVVEIGTSGEVQSGAGPIRLGTELKLSPIDAVNALRDQFQGAVERQCNGVRRVAVMTGGGVDSSNILAIAVGNERRRGTASVVPLAFDFGGPGDERPHLRALCKHLAIQPIRVRPVEGARYAGQDQVVDGAAHSCAPAATMFAAMARARAAGVERILDGQASELLLDSEPAVFGDFLLHDPLNALRSVASFHGLFESRAMSWRRLVAGPLLRRALPDYVLEMRESQLHAQRVEQQRLEVPWASSRLRAFFAAKAPYPTRPPIYSQRDRVINLASSELVMATRENASRWEAATGMPIYFPYLDDEFAIFAGRLPSSAIFIGSRERGLLRESMAGLVPDSVRYRADKARPYHAFAELFSTPAGRASVADLVSMRELGQLDVVDPSGFRAAFDRFAADPYANPRDWETLWSAITAEAYVRWFQEFKHDSTRHESRQDILRTSP